VGLGSGYNNVGGSDNTAVGFAAGTSSPNGSDNTVVGVGAGGGAGGNYNTIIGTGAGSSGYGNLNLFVGASAGFTGLWVGDSNVYVASYGQDSESNTMRLGFPYTTNPAYCPFQIAPCGQNTTVIVGIYGSTSSGGVPVYINSNGQLGTLTSSRRFKEQVRDMGSSSSGLMKLRPVTFLYKPEYDKGPRTLQYGLIAEEVAEVYPDLVAYEADGKPYTVKYQYLTTMLLNEMQKQYHRAEVQAKVIKTQQQEIDGLKAHLQLQNAAFQERLSRLESIVGPQTQTAANLPQQ
jgi:hypothetical protein